MALPSMLLSVAEAREARERARPGAAEKGQEAHRWLGERYRRLLESADAIGDLGVAARDATAFATAVEAKARDATAASQATPALPPPPAKITSPDAAAAKAAALAPELWRAFDANDHGDAASCYLAVAALTTQAQGALGPVARMLRTRCRSDRCAARTHGRGVTIIVLRGRGRGACIVRRLRGAARESRAPFPRVATGVVVHSEADPEQALRTAATAVARTVTDLNDLFLDGAFAASVAADPPKRASAHRLGSHRARLLRCHGRGPVGGLRLDARRRAAS